MNRKEFTQQLNIERGRHEAAAPDQSATDETGSHEHTEVKNANAAGQGALGRDDEQLQDDDESGKVY